MNPDSDNASRNGAAVSVLRVSVTDRCNMRCIYCMPPKGHALVSHDEVLRYEEIVRIVELLVERFGLKAVRLTGGEPLVRKGIEQLIGMLNRLGLDDISLTTNGALLEAQATALRSAGLNRVNVSLDTLKADRYTELTRGGNLAQVLAGLRAAAGAGLAPVKINTLVLRDWNEDELPDMLEFASDNGWRLRFLELLKIGEAQAAHEDLFVPRKEILDRLSERYVLKPIGATGSVAELWRAEAEDGRRIEFGLIASESKPFCLGCRRLRLTSCGRLYGCLMQPDWVDLRAWLRGGGEAAHFDELVRSALAVKRERRPASADSMMTRLGG